MAQASFDTVLPPPLADLFCRVLAFHGRRVPTSGGGAVETRTPELLSATVNPHDTTSYWAAPNAPNNVFTASLILEMAMHSSQFSASLFRFMNPPRAVLFATVRRLMMQLIFPLARTLEVAISGCSSEALGLNTTVTAARAFAEHAPLMLQWLSLLAAADGKAESTTTTTTSEFPHMHSASSPFSIGAALPSEVALVDVCWDDDATEDDFERSYAMRAASAIATAYAEQLRVSHGGPGWLDSPEASLGRLWICMLMRLLVQVDVACGSKSALTQTLVTFGVRRLLLELIQSLLEVPTVATSHAVVLVFQAAMGSSGTWRNLALLPDCLDLVGPCFRRWADQPDCLQTPECRISALNIARPVYVHPWVDPSSASADAYFDFRRRFSLLHVLLSTAARLKACHDVITHATHEDDHHNHHILVEKETATTTTAAMMTTTTTTPPPRPAAVRTVLMDDNDNDDQRLAKRCLGAAYALIWMFQQMGVIPQPLKTFVVNAPRYVLRRLADGTDDLAWGGYSAASTVCKHLRNLLPALQAMEASHVHECLSSLNG